ncbi:uncharacterized protein VTP21DRAFT_6854 [Calcarisporiella thermophila]|uniref:uncharacterized protein n=1 Tax=Calcarisporiella thermophila TaxID=911321 RepID=UPI003744158B
MSDPSQCTLPRSPVLPPTRRVDSPSSRPPSRVALPPIAPVRAPRMPVMPPLMPRSPAGPGSSSPAHRNTGMGGKPKFGLKLNDIGGFSAQKNSTPFAKFSRYVDPSGKLNFSGKAILHAEGVDFTSGVSYRIKMDELEVCEELGKGQYGTVHKVFHRPTNVTMAMKEIRLELDESRLSQILMELDILHKSTSEYIVEFYGAFFIESCVYLCMEYMDCGSLDKLYGCGVPEDVMAKITESMVKGLRFLKDELNIIHRDIKPTNVLINRKGQVKLCDFGVSGQLIQSMAKTNIGCQPYMAPERISVEQGSAYTAQADVWSLGLSLLEVATGSYPYKYDNMFAQLSAIVQGEVPTLPAELFSDDAVDFVSQCLNKDPKARPTYSQLLEHQFIKRYESVEVDMEAWAQSAFKARKEKENAQAAA